MRWCISEAPAMMDAMIAMVDNASSKTSLVRNRRRLRMLMGTRILGRHTRPAYASNRMKKR
jgi:hypothetical protein